MPSPECKAWIEYVELTQDRIADALKPYYLKFSSVGQPGTPTQQDVRAINEILTNAYARAKDISLALRSTEMTWKGWGPPNDTFFKESNRWYKDVKEAAKAGRSISGTYVVFHNMPSDHWKV
jgi:hypothetical protein